MKHEELEKVARELSQVATCLDSLATPCVYDDAPEDGNDVYLAVTVECARREDAEVMSERITAAVEMLVEEYRGRVLAEAERLLGQYKELRYART